VGWGGLEHGGELDGFGGEGMWVDVLYGLVEFDMALMNVSNMWLLLTMMLNLWLVSAVTSGLWCDSRIMSNSRLLQNVV
jgi:hypothetical protein